MRRHPSGFRILARALAPAPTLVSALALLVLAPPAGAQYMYLDSNGDGVHTATDEVHGTGPTVVDIWLDIAHNRDGSAATCSANPAASLDMFGYEVVLEAVDGTATFSPFTNRLSEMGLVGVPHEPDGIHYFSGLYFASGTTSLPPGKYLLGSLTINVASGTPSIHIIPTWTWTTPSVYDDYTLFSSHCDGTDYPNSIALGINWFDADGLTFAAGGTPNQTPDLAAIPNISLVSGENAIRAITASDPEGQSLTFSKASGPPFLSVASLSPGSGTASGEVRLAPFASDVGTAAATVSVTDGAASDQANFQITVSLGTNHPPYVAPIPNVTVIAGRTGNFFLGAGDPDGGTLHFAKTSGPAYVSLRELAARPGGGSALVTLRPAIGDVGTATAAFSVTDGVASLERKMALKIVPPSPVPFPATHYFSAGFMNAIRLADMNGDGNLDVIAAQEDQPMISIFMGSPSGELGAQILFPVLGQNGAIAVGDFNQDGKVDVAVTNSEGAALDVYPGRGDGSLLDGTTYATGEGPTGIAAVDLNRDGILDLITMNQESGTVSVLIGAGNGTFATKHDTPAGFRPLSYAIGDFNLDGRPDIALTSPGAGVFSTLTVLPGLGDGTFGDGILTSINGYPFSLMSGDWNWDGMPDLAFVDIRGTVQTLLGRGDGTFDPSVTVLTVQDPSTVYAGAAEDMNGDGNMDLVVSDVNVVRLLILLGNGAGRFATPVSLSGRFAEGLAIGDMNRDGRPDMVGTAAPAIGVYLNSLPAPALTVPARAFVVTGKSTFPLSKRDVCVRIEAGGDAADGTPVVDPNSVVLSSEGTGSVSEIHAVPAKRLVAADTDQNQSPEITVCFDSQDLGALFDKIRKRTTVTAQLSGRVIDGRTFSTSIDLELVGEPLSSEASFAPNPLNPVSRLTFSTVRDGPAKAQVFSIGGRLIRTLLDAPHLRAGAHEYLFDGKGDRGEQLPSGVYFYRVESTGGRFEGRIVILK